MPLYEYKGVGTAGKSTKGIIEAESAKTARVKLKQKGVFTTEIKEKNPDKLSKEKKSGGRISASGGVKMKNFTMMTRQLSTLVKANPFG